ncbi:MAG: hypothetical protein NWT08_11675 [Akkermansiaceae bacterium]|jgi:hypothetical protein|nr:hypothetical protein [Akkermansiaceae bacterium]MDP4646395.1 hypothetical protein [Akkermansiaceae bacterium]MDP4721914.1 hypothetical protein [Akkermansiaceae bacterium]MDP4779998.1 hypothetical protein [Akkermansiaceae bacterium]MDP4847076.1 hypothetical protein [Akkermansiaceae bacterium]
MAKTNNQHLLLPGESEWEIWTLAADGSTTLESSHPVATASEITKFPAGDIIHFFPVKELTAVPMHVPSGDTSLFPDLAETHAERLGFRPDPFAGQLTDIFPTFVNSESSTFLNVILRNPQDGSLPTKSPKAFDISPRAFPVPGNTLSLWRELGAWVFAIHREGKLIYCQATASTGTSLDDSLIRAIRIAIAQLSMQGIEASPSKATVWSSDPETKTQTLSQGLSLQTELSPRPAPVVPSPLSKLLPADVRAARRVALKKRNITLAIAAVALIYLGTVGYLAFGLWQTHSKAEKLNAQVDLVAPENEAFTVHIGKWDELAYALDPEYSTVGILNRVAKSIPKNSGLRLRTAEISPTEIRLIGEAPQPDAVNQFSLNLNNSNDLVSYEWETPAPKQSSRGWEFVFTGVTPTTP